MKDFFISVIIPAYNAGKTIVRCLESVNKSTYSDFECIVVDDHSSDNTIELVEVFNPTIIKADRQQGAANARNQGAEAARGDIFLFIDSDVTIYPDTLEKVAEAFRQHSDIAAVFGSYDDQPDGSNLLSQYKNLFHRYIHQTSQTDASTFWTACGAIKREVFFEVGKFNEKCRMMEDVELGYKMKAKGYNILLMKDLLVKHLKYYTFTSLIKSDFLDRAIPWTVLILNNKQFKGDLNLKPSHKISAMVLVLMVVSLLIALKSAWYLLAFLCLFVAFYLLNYDFYRYFLLRKGIVFTTRIIPLHILYYCYSSIGFAIGVCQHYLIKKA